LTRAATSVILCATFRFHIGITQETY